MQSRFTNHSSHIIHSFIHITWLYNDRNKQIHIPLFPFHRLTHISVSSALFLAQFKSKYFSSDNHGIIIHDNTEKLQLQIPNYKQMHLETAKNTFVAHV